MAENTKIEWAHHTFNPWIGCTKVSPACDHCYAEADFDKRRHVVQWGAGQPRKHTAPSTWKHPERWNAEAERLGVPQTVFCASLADWADNEVPPEWRAELAGLILRTPNLIWLLLTKRIGNAKAMLAQMFPQGVPPNVRVGATICNQPEADRDIPKLVSLGLPNFISIEPMLGPVNLRAIPVGEGEIDALKPDTWEEAIELWRDTSDTWQEDFEDWFNVSIPAEGLSGPMHAGIDWVIVGGESGPQARPMHPDWARSLRDQCEAAGVPFLFKQWGEYTAHPVDPESYAAHLSCIDREGRECALSRGEQARSKGEGWWFLPPHPGRGTWGPDGIPDGVVEVRRPGKKAAGRLLDGRTWDGVPV